MSEFTEMVTYEEQEHISNGIVSGMSAGAAGVWASFDVMADDESKAAAFNAISDPGEAIMDMNNQVIEINDVLITPVKVIGDSGENICPRCIIMSGTRVFTATSWGVYHALQRMNSLFGTLHFPEGKKAMVKVVKTKRGKTVNLNLV